MSTSFLFVSEVSSDLSPEVRAASNRIKSTITWKHFWISIGFLKNLGKCEFLTSKQTNKIFNLGKSTLDILIWKSYIIHMFNVVHCPRKDQTLKPMLYHFSALICLFSAGNDVNNSVNSDIVKTRFSFVSLAVVAMVTQRATAESWTIINFECIKQLCMLMKVAAALSLLSAAATAVCLKDCQNIKVKSSHKVSVLKDLCSYTLKTDPNLWSQNSNTNRSEFWHLRSNLSLIANLNWQPETLAWKDLYLKNIYWTFRYKTWELTRFNFI